MKNKVIPSDLQLVGGATTSKVQECFVNICPRAEQELSLICTEGLEKHNDSWRYTKDPKSFQAERLNHLLKHLNNYRQSGDFEEIAKVMWGCMAMIHFDTGCKCQEIFAMRKETK